MSDVPLVACPVCASINRVPAAKIGAAPICGKCGMPLFQGQPVDVDQAAFDRHVGRGSLPVLVDFWASWCGPCRGENPNLVMAYNQFKGKNFTVLGVSLDRPGQKDKWLQAIKDDKLAWTHVSDLQEWRSAVIPLYGFDGIPFNVLIDPSGKVIAEGLRGSRLTQTLQEVLQ